MTGRTHQIRIHLLALGHGIVGDPLYKNRGFKEKTKPERIFLHAIELSFDDLAGVRHSYKSELPNQLKDFLTKIK
jgi:23S rRNA pseudouridine1911/1915/1917 synthase